MKKELQMKSLTIAALVVVALIAVLAAVKADEDTISDGHAGHDHGVEVGEPAGSTHGHDDSDEENAGDCSDHDHASEVGDAHGQDRPEHDTEDEHAGHDHGEEAQVGLSERDMTGAGIAVGVAGPGAVELTTRLLGEVRVNEERLAHVVPTVSGVVREVHVRIGEEVSAGDLLAVMASRELAEARADYMSAHGRRELAIVEYERQKELREGDMVAEQDYLDSRQALSEADIELRAAEQTLHALGVGERELENLTVTHEAGALTGLELRAPLSGTVIEMHIVTGEVVSEDSDLLVIADLNTVWVDLHVPQSTLSSIQEEQEVTISARGLGISEVSGVVSFVSPIIDPETRTALARVVISNESGEWRPGLFVTADVSFERAHAPVLVPSDAVQTLDGEAVVFVPEGAGFRSVPIVLGRSTSTHAEILSGLGQGERYVEKGAYALKAEIVTSGLDSHAGHGH
jgi:cobalt-zinc-cadmium efflux system membrane fusion protein